MRAVDFRKAYEDLFLPLCMYALRMTMDVDDARDIVQGVFTTAWQRVLKEEDITSFKGYMYRGVHNACVTFLRNRMPKEEIAVTSSVRLSTENVEVITIPDELTEEDIDTAERDAALWKAIDSLPDRCREIFLMSKRDGMRNAEIAEELGISIKTVENQITKAFAALRGNPGLRSGMVFFLPFL